MLRYIARRLLIAFPTLFAILLISFMISRGVPGDPVLREMDSQFREGSSMSADLRDQEYRRIKHAHGLDLPLFYVSMQSIAYPDTLHRILVLSDRENLELLIDTYGNWPEISAYHQTVIATLRRVKDIHVTGDALWQVQEAQRALEELKMVATVTEIGYRLALLDSLVGITPILGGDIAAGILHIRNAFERVEAEATTWRLYVPTFHFYGFDNQFHAWLSRLLTLDFGRSYVDHRLVGTKIVEALPWTVFMGIFSFSIAYLVAIPLGIYAVRMRNKWQDRGITIFLFLLYSVPTFVAAMLTMTFLCNPEYLQIFPTNSVNSDGAERWPLMYRILDYIYHLTLPTLIFSYGSIAFVSRQLRSSLIDNFHADYVRTARAKGLPEETVIWRHALRNSLLPIITHFASLFPLLVGGALVTEFIFSIPGMGLLTMDALGTFDHPVLMAVFTLTTIATLIGFFVSDILYALADPRISYIAKT